MRVTADLDKKFVVGVSTTTGECCRTVGTITKFCWSASFSVKQHARAVSLMSKPRTVCSVLVKILSTSSFRWVTAAVALLSARIIKRSNCQLPCCSPPQAHMAHRKIKLSYFGVSWHLTECYSVRCSVATSPRFQCSVLFIQHPVVCIVPRIGYFATSWAQLCTTCVPHRLCCIRNHSLLTAFIVLSNPLAYYNLLHC